eukprot:GEMP01045363.1.p1 GENE.GEMP01045363.1~~GEMP01045363.1.p1  ORF type:complete len:409 (+),score=112.56 GEMP01045363.1:107-1333(+)
MRNLKTLRRVSWTALSMADHLRDESSRPPESNSGDESSDKGDVIDATDDLVDKKQDIIADLVEQRELLMETSEELKRANDELQKQLYAQKEQNQELTEANRRLVRQLDEMKSATATRVTAFGTPLGGVTPKTAEVEDVSMLSSRNLLKATPRTSIDDDSVIGAVRDILRATPRELETAKAASRDERMVPKHLLATQLRFSQLEQREAQSSWTSQGSAKPSAESNPRAPSACSSAGVTHADKSRRPRERTTHIVRDTPHAGQSLPKALSTGQLGLDSGRTTPHSARSSTHDLLAALNGRRNITVNPGAKAKAAAGPSREKGGAAVYTRVLAKDAPDAPDAQVRATKDTPGHSTKNTLDLRTDALGLSSSKAMPKKSPRPKSDVANAAELSAALKKGDARWGRLLGNVKM